NRYILRWLLLHQRDRRGQHVEVVVSEFQDEVPGAHAGAQREIDSQVHRAAVRLHRRVADAEDLHALRRGSHGTGIEHNRRLSRDRFHHRRFYADVTEVAIGYAVINRNVIARSDWDIDPRDDHATGYVDRPELREIART